MAFGELNSVPERGLYNVVLNQLEVTITVLRIGVYHLNHKVTQSGSDLCGQEGGGPPPDETCVPW